MGENGKNGKNEKKILALGFNNFYCINKNLTRSASNYRNLENWAKKN